MANYTIPWNLPQKSAIPCKLSLWQLFLFPWFSSNCSITKIKLVTDQQVSARSIIWLYCRRPSITVNYNSITIMTSGWGLQQRPTSPITKIHKNRKFYMLPVFMFWKVETNLDSYSNVTCIIQRRIIYLIFDKMNTTGRWIYISSLLSVQQHYFAEYKSKKAFPQIWLQVQPTIIMFNSRLQWNADKRWRQFL